MNRYFLVILLFFLIGCGGSSNKSKKLIIAKNDKIYFGAFPDFGGSEDKVSAKKIKEFENLVGKKIAWCYFSQNWFNGIKYPKKDIDEIYNSGSIPFVRLMPRSNEEQGFKEKYFSLQNIIDGKFDKELIKWAKDAKENNIPLLMDFAVEANGDWFGWSGKFNGGGKKDSYGDPNYPDGPERYKDAYRHIIDIFNKVGAKNITWFYHFNYISFPQEEWNLPKYYYPGDDYIDWVGFSLYGAQTADEEWNELKFSTQLKRYINTYKSLKSKKPVALLEFGVTNNHPQADKAKWLDDAFKTILNNPYIKFKAISPWHENWQNEDESYSTLRVDSTQESLNTFKKWIKDNRFISSLKFK